MRYTNRRILYFTLLYSGNTGRKSNQIKIAISISNWYRSSS